jgi:hypothetical protein
MGDLVGEGICGGEDRGESLVQIKNSAFRIFGLSPVELSLRRAKRLRCWRATYCITLFTRFRGLSTSSPLITATW